MSDVESTILPNGAEFILRLAYSAREMNGVTVLVVISCISLVAVVGLLAVISLSAFNTRTSLDQHLFVRTHVAAYFICLLFSDLLQAIGSILNARWLERMGVEVGDICTAQGVLKQASDVGTAFWTLVIAIHTFCLLVLELKLRKFVLWTTLISGWSGIAALVIAGPAALDTNRRGPFHSISGYWCWISNGYGLERITLDYMLMFMAAFLSFILYTLIFLKLRGNLYLDKRRPHFRRISKERANNWRATPMDNQAMTIARQMLLYPIAYTVLILPIATTRFTAWAGHEVPFEATIFSGAVFLLSGTVNVILFTTTRRILPPQSMTMKISISRPKILRSSTPTNGLDPYYTYSDSDSSTFTDEEKGYGYNQTFKSSSTDTSRSLSIPDQHGIAPLRIQKPARVAVPQIDIPARRTSTADESMYSLYMDHHRLSNQTDIYDHYPGPYNGNHRISSQY